MSLYTSQSFLRYNPNWSSSEKFMLKNEICPDTAGSICLAVLESPSPNTHSHIHKSQQNVLEKPHLIVPLCKAQSLVIQQEEQQKPMKLRIRVSQLLYRETTPTDSLKGKVSLRLTGPSKFLENKGPTPSFSSEGPSPLFQKKCLLLYAGPNPSNKT